MSIQHHTYRQATSRPTALRCATLRCTCTHSPHTHTTTPLPVFPQSQHLSAALLHVRASVSRTLATFVGDLGSQVCTNRRSKRVTSSERSTSFALAHRLTVLFPEVHPDRVANLSDGTCTWLWRVDWRQSWSQLPLRRRFLRVRL